MATLPTGAIGRNRIAILHLQFAPFPVCRQDGPSAHGTTIERGVYENAI